MNDIFDKIEKLKDEKREIDRIEKEKKQKKLESEKKEKEFQANVLHKLSNEINKLKSEYNIYVDDVDQDNSNCKIRRNNYTIGSISFSGRYVFSISSIGSSETVWANLLIIKLDIIGKANSLLFETEYSVFDDVDTFVDMVITRFVSDLIKAGYISL